MPRYLPHTSEAAIPRPRSFPIAGVAISLSAMLVAATPATAQAPISCNETIVASIDVPGEIDSYTFQAEAGEAFTIFRVDTAVYPTFSAILVELLAPDGSTIPADPAIGLSYGPLAESGAYEIRAWKGLGRTGSYELTLVSTRLGGARCEPFAPIRCGESVVGEFEGDETPFHFRSFQAAGGDFLTLSGTPAFLVAPDGLPVRDALFFGGRVPLAGTYTVAWRPGDYGGRLQAVTLETLSGSFNGGSNAGPTPICGAPRDGTRTIGCGETKSGAIDVLGDRDLYTFFAERDDVVRVEVAPSGTTSFWAFARIYGEGASPVQEFYYHDRTVTIPANGAYWIEVSASNTYEAGDYAVTLTRTPCASACGDGVDNDGDALVDLPQDGGCTSSDDLSERPECSDGRDNDLDGRTDFAQRDAGCPSHVGVTEDPACDDGFDNDRDGGIDADGGGSGVPDEFCAGTPTQAFEHAGAFFSCGLGPELALLLPFLRAFRRRAR